MEIITLSPSMAGSIRTCTTQALLRAGGWGMGPENEKAKAGKAFHRALEQWVMGRSNDECLAAFHADYDRFSDEYVLTDSKYHKGNLSRILGVYLRRNPLSQQAFEIIEAEQQIEVEEQWAKDTMIVLTDIQDSIVRMKDSGELWSRELKTTGSWISDSYVRDYYLRGQILSHVWTARKHGFPVVGVMLEVIEINKLPELGKVTAKGLPYKCRTHGVPAEECWAGHVKFARYQIQPTEETVERWLTDARMAAIDLGVAIKTYPDVVHAPRQGVLNGSCGRCDFQSFCLAPDPSKLTRRERDTKARMSGLEIR